LTKTAELADFVLPAQAPTEREGTFTSGERRLQRFYQVAHPKGETKADFDIAAEIGTRFGLSIQGKHPSLVFPQICQEIPTFNGLTYQKLAEVSEQWPIIGRNDLYYGGTGYANYQGLGVQLEYSENLEIQELKLPALPNGDLIAIPITELFDLGTMVIPSNVIHSRLADPYITINPEDAKVQKTTEGMTVSIDVNGILAEVNVITDKDVPVGYAFLPLSCGIPINKPTEIKIRIAETVAT
jgi:NADH-quinone oxidoreductase subunit G